MTDILVGLLFANAFLLLFTAARARLYRDQAKEIHKDMQETFRDHMELVRLFNQVKVRHQPVKPTVHEVV